MPDYSIRNNCKINTNWAGDTFVGIKSENGDFTISFPLGFHISDDEKGLRRDILLLFKTLSTMSDKTESTLLENTSIQDKSGFPIQAYLFLISDYYRRGYYKEKDIKYVTNTRGKIDWGRTIKKQKPFIQGTDVYYLRFTTRRNPPSENELITLIHELCVYESFCKLGWLFTTAMPKKPQLKFNRKLFRSVVFGKYQNTYNEYNKELFLNMMLIIDNITNPDAPQRFSYGVDSFDHVWEALVDIVFGSVGKEMYFPKTFWQIDNEYYENSELRPDSIMICDENVFVLDAKNYKYGVTRRPSDLPQSADINKQITYAEYIAKEKKFKRIHGEEFNVYNAFIMPYDASEWSDIIPMRWIGEATAQWKNNQLLYEHVQGIMVDVKHLMKAVNQKMSMIEELADFIESISEKKDS